MKWGAAFSGTWVSPRSVKISSLKRNFKYILYKSKQCHENFQNYFFQFFATKPYNVGVYGLPWTQACKIWYFELTQDHLNPEDTEGMRRSLCLFCSKPLQYGCLWTCLDLSNQDLTFMYGCPYYNSLGSQSEQGRPGGPILSLDFYFVCFFMHGGLSKMLAKSQ